jgi:hypothetical protein
MWVLQRIEDKKFVAKSENTQMTGSTYTSSLRNAKKFNNKEEAIADSCIENEVPVQIDPYDYFK